MSFFFAKGNGIHLHAYHTSALCIWERGLVILMGLSWILSVNAYVSRYTKRYVRVNLPENSSCIMGKKNALIFWDGQLVPAPRPFSHCKALKFYHGGLEARSYMSK